MARDSAPGPAYPRPPSATRPSEAEANPREFEAGLTESERATMQLVQASLQLIAFGFTITSFAFDAVIKGVAGDADLPARRVGSALLALGLLTLGFGFLDQARRRWRLLRRHAPNSPTGEPTLRAEAYLTPGMVTALLLLLIGTAALVAVLQRWMA